MRRRCAAIPSAPLAVSLHSTRHIEAGTAHEVVKLFTEVIIAPDATPEARDIIAAKKNLRLLLVNPLPDPSRPATAFKSVSGGFLVQSRDSRVVRRDDLKIVTRRKPNSTEMDDMIFRLHGRQACEVQCDCLCEGSGYRRHWCGPNVARRCKPHRRHQERGSRSGAGHARPRSLSARWSPRTHFSLSPTGCGQRSRRGPPPSSNRAAQSRMRRS